MVYQMELFIVLTLHSLFKIKDQHQILKVLIPKIGEEKDNFKRELSGILIGAISAIKRVILVIDSRNYMENSKI